MNLEFCLSHKCATQVNDFELCRTYRWAAKAQECLRKKNSIWNNQLNQLWLLRNEITRLKDFLQKYWECYSSASNPLSSFTISTNLPLFLLGSSRFNILYPFVTQHIHYLSCAHVQIMSTWASPLIYSFLILSILLIPNENVKMMSK